MPRPNTRWGNPVPAQPVYPDYTEVKDILVPYRRVSTREQALKGVGLDAQATTIENGLKIRGQQALTWDCEDRGKSGKNMDRAGLDAALEHVRAGRASGIIVSKLDRLSRSLLDFAHLMATAEKEGWNIVALDLGVDLQTPAGKMMAGILAVFAEFERNLINQRTQDALAEKRARGVKLGRNRTTSDETLRLVVEKYQESPNYCGVARWLNANNVPLPEGGKQWYPAGVSRLVNSSDGRAMLEQIQNEMA